MDYSKLGAAAAASDNLTEEKGFTREIPREGVALLRLRDYIETGRHEAKNPQHKPSLKVMLVFELSHPDHMIEIQGKKVPQSFTVRVNKSYSDKGKYMPLFKVMNRACGGKFTHFAEMVGQAFLGRIYHNEYQGTKYANLDLDGAWSIQAPVQEDALSGTKTPVPVPELDGTPKVFLWEPQGFEDSWIQEMWDSIYIEGTRTNDKGEEISKNWIQETIMKNVEWEGSMTQGITQEFVSIDEPDNLSSLAGAATSIPNLD